MIRTLLLAGAAMTLVAATQPAAANDDARCRLAAAAVWPNTADAFENDMRAQTYALCMQRQPAPKPAKVTPPPDTAPTTIPFPLFHNPPPGSAAARGYETEGRPLPKIDTAVALQAACMGYGYDGPDMRAPQQCKDFIKRVEARNPSREPVQDETGRESFIRFMHVHPEAEQWLARRAVETAFCATVSRR
jgi:hypothetical protein